MRIVPAEPWRCVPSQVRGAVAGLVGYPVIFFQVDSKSRLKPPAWIDEVRNDTMKDRARRSLPAFDQRESGSVRTVNGARLLSSSSTIVHPRSFLECHAWIGWQAVVVLATAVK